MEVAEKVKSSFSPRNATETPSNAFRRSFHAPRSALSEQHTVETVKDFNKNMSFLSVNAHEVFRSLEALSAGQAHIRDTLLTNNKDFSDMKAQQQRIEEKLDKLLAVAPR